MFHLGQVLDIKELQGNIKDLYVMSKIWKARFPEARFKSYMVKKLLLDPSRRERVMTKGGKTWNEIIRECKYPTGLSVGTTKARKVAWEELMNGPLKKFAQGGMTDQEYAENIQMFLGECI